MSFARLIVKFNFKWIEDKIVLYSPARCECNHQVQACSHGQNPEQSFCQCEFAKISLWFNPNISLNSLKRFSEFYLRLNPMCES